MHVHLSLYTNHRKKTWQNQFFNHDINIVKQCGETCLWHFLKVNSHGFTLEFYSLFQLPQKSAVNFSCVLFLAVVVNRRNRKHRTTVRFRTIWYKMRKHEQTACANIPLPSCLIEFIDIPPIFILSEYTSLILWMQIFSNQSIATPHKPVLKTKQIEAYRIISVCLVITIKHVSILEFILYIDK